MLVSLVGLVVHRGCCVWWSWQGEVPFSLVVGWGSTVEGALWFQLGCHSGGNVVGVVCVCV